ncbi:MAG TPA: tetratricopeptide repeat protein [Thermomicrobiales bacterium]|nr:tetratricopeptide repeat protein [Thermomicrobiales bacterium]
MSQMAGSGDTDRASATGVADSAANCYAAGMAALRQGDLETARQWAVRCAAVAADSADCEALHGAIATEDGEFDEAIGALKRATALAPQNAAFARQLGEALAANGQAREARDVLAQAADRAPDDADLLVDLAYMQMTTGNPGGARTAIERAATARPASTAIREAQARIYEAAGAPELATTTLAQLAQAAPTPRTLTDLARLSLEQARYADADAAFRQLAAIDPEHDLVALHGRIWCAIKRGDWRSALELSLGATRIDRYDLTTALLAYAKDRLFTQPPAGEAAAREAELGERVKAALWEHSTLHADDASAADAGTEEEERG